MRMRCLGLLTNSPYRDLLSRGALTVIERLPVFGHFVDKDRISLAVDRHKDLAGAILQLGQHPKSNGLL